MSMKSIILLLLWLLLLFSVASSLSNYVERNRPPLPADYEEEYIILDGERLRGFCFGLEGLVADYYWMQTLQYFGKKILSAKERGEAINIQDLRPLNPKMIYPLLENVTDLDPKFTDAYLFASLVLSALDADKAIELAEKGIRNSPNDWRLYHYLGFIYWRKGEYEKASEVYFQGSSLPDAPSFMKLAGAKIKAEGGSRETARQIYRQIYEESNSTQVKETVLTWLKFLDSLDERDVIRQALQSYKQKYGTCPKNWRELIPELKQNPKANTLPVDSAGNLYDPTGAPYLLNSTTCDVELDIEKTQLPLR